MPRIRLIAAGALLALGACTRDATSPPPAVDDKDLTVQVNATAGDPVLFRGQQGEQLIECSVTFLAVATGEQGAEGRWTGAVLRYFVGNTTRAADSLVMADHEARQAFGAEFQPGSQRTAGIRLVSRTPFTLEIELRYRVDGAQADRAATGRTTCGVPPGAPGAAPAVSSVSIVPSGGELEPGDTLRVSWTATGSPAVWETGIEIVGAFSRIQRLAGEGRATITHTADVVVPAGANLGEPFQLRVYASDPWVRGTASPTWTSPPLVDRTPPTAYAVGTTRPTDLLPPALRGQYGTTDSIRVFGAIQDNHGLAWLVYQLGPQGVRDSVALTPGKFDPYFFGIPVPLGERAAGATELRVHFRDAAGNRTPEFVSAPGAVRVYPVRNVTVRSVQVPERPEDVLVDPVRNRLYTVVVNRMELRVYSLPGMALERTVPLPFSVTNLELTADGDSLLLSSRYYTGIAVMHVNATTAPATRQLSSVSYLFGIRIAHTGRAIALGAGADGRELVMEVDLATGAERVIATGFNAPGEDEGVTRSRDRRTMLLGAGCAFDVQTERVGPCRVLDTGGATGPVSGGATGRYWGRYLHVFDSSLQPVLRLDNRLQDLRVGIVPAEDGGAYVSSFRGLLRVGPDGTIAERLAGPALGYLRFSDDGTVAASWEFGEAAEGGHRIRILDLR